MNSKQGASKKMLVLKVPSSPGLTEALGHLAVAHTHLELVFRYTYKTVVGITVKEALKATDRWSITNTREEVRRSFITKKPQKEDVSKIDKILAKAKKLSDTRNKYLHSAWSETSAGQIFVKTENYNWGQAPTVKEITETSSKILDLVKEINDARLYGFINDVVVRNTRE